MKTLIVSAFTIVMLVLCQTGSASAGSGYTSNMVDVDGNSVNSASGGNSGDSAVAIANSAINFGSATTINEIDASSVINTATGTGALAISTSAVNSTGSTTINDIDSNGKVSNTATKRAKAICNTVINGQMPR